MGVRVIKMQGGAVFHLEFIGVGLAGIDRLRGMAVAAMGTCSPLPMGDGLFGQFIVQADADLLPCRKRSSGPRKPSAKGATVSFGPAATCAK